MSLDDATREMLRACTFFATAVEGPGMVIHVPEPRTILRLFGLPKTQLDNE